MFVFKEVLRKEKNVKKNYFLIYYKKNIRENKYN